MNPCRGNFHPCPFASLSWPGRAKGKTSRSDILLSASVTGRGAGVGERNNPGGGGSVGEDSTPGGGAILGCRRKPDSGGSSGGGN